MERRVTSAPVLNAISTPSFGRAIVPPSMSTDHRCASRSPVTRSVTVPVPLLASVTFAEPPIWSGRTVAEKDVPPDAVVPELGAADAAGVGVGDAAGAALARGDADGLGDEAGEADGLAAASTIAPLNRSAIPAPMAANRRMSGPPGSGRRSLRAKDRLEPVIRCVGTRARPSVPSLGGDPCADGE